MDNLVAARIASDDSSADLVKFSIVYPDSTQPSYESLLEAYQQLLAHAKESEESHRIVQTAYEQSCSSVSVLQQELVHLREVLRCRDESIRKLNESIVRRDNRKKNSEALLEVVERRNKELIEEVVRRDRDALEWRKKLAETASDLQQSREETASQAALCRKREEQIQALIAQLKRKDAEIAQAAKAAQRKSAEVRELSNKLAAASREAEGAVRVRLQRELEQAEGLAAAKEGEIKLVKEIVKSYHVQLRQKDAEMQQIRKKAVKLPPIESVPVNSPARIKATTRKIAWKSPRSGEELEAVLRRSQEAVRRKPEERKGRSTQSVDHSETERKKDMDTSNAKGDNPQKATEDSHEEVLKPSLVANEYDPQGEIQPIGEISKPVESAIQSAAAFPESEQRRSDSPGSDRQEKKIFRGLTRSIRTKNSALSHHSEDSLRSSRSAHSVLAVENAESPPSNVPVIRPHSGKSSSSSSKSSRKSSSSSERSSSLAS